MSEERSGYQAMREERLTAIEARDKARTPGEWFDIPHPEWTGANHRIDNNPNDSWANFGQLCYASGPNAAFIAGCSVDVPELLAEVRRLKQQEASLSQCRRELLILLAWAKERTYNIREPLQALRLPNDIDGRVAFMRWLNAAADEGKRIIEEAQRETGEGR